ncbi:hypothetical protein DRQ09_08840 [candidate division KSB1 bacterium]|nr:MAG: hypothetical protein DRQ09_08840 [candidate division KSB1 bacterium]
MNKSKKKYFILKRVSNIDDRLALFIFTLLAFYGFFPFGIENRFLIGTLRILIIIIFSVFILLRSKGEEIPEKDEKELPEKVEKDIEIIQKFADHYCREKKFDTEKEFENYIKRILKVIQESFSANSVLLGLFDQEKNELVIKTYVGRNDSLKSELYFSPNEDFSNIIFECEKTIIFQEEKVKEYEKIVYKSEENIVSVLVTPIFISGEVIGCIFLDRKVKKDFDENDKNIIESYADIITSTILNYNNIYEYENSLSLFSAFYEISKKLNSNLGFDEIIDILIDILKKIFNYDRISISFIEDESGNAIIKKVVGQTDEFVENYKFSIEEGLNGWVIRKNKSILVSDLEKGDYFIPRYTIKEKSNHELRSFVAAPISYHNRCLGVISVESRKPNLYTDRHEKILSLLANNIGIALDRSMIYNQLENLATTDGLTGVNNYRHFRKKLAEEIERAKRYNLKFSLLMLDIDHFKDFNDRYGHLVGDNILKNIADTIKTSIRSIDFVARYGGEEFAIILIETVMDEAYLSAERIRRNIEKLRISYQGGTYSVTVSIGISEYSTGVKSEDELVAQADKALYQAKAEGRNRVVTYEKL